MANLDPEKASWLNIGAKTATGPNLGTLAENQKKIVTVFSRDTFQNLIYGKQLIGTAASPLTGEVPYPCKSNLDYKCLFVEGERLNDQSINGGGTGQATYDTNHYASFDDSLNYELKVNGIDYYFDFDHVHVIFTEDATLTAGWHVILPTILK